MPAQVRRGEGRGDVHTRRADMAQEADEPSGRCRRVAVVPGARGERRRQRTGGASRDPPRSRVPRVQTRAVQHQRDDIQARAGTVRAAALVAVLLHAHREHPIRIR